MLSLKNIMKLTISHQPVRVLNATSKRKGQEETFKPRLQGTDRDNESTVALERDETSEIGFMTVEREKWPNARVGPADGGGLFGPRSQCNAYHGSFCIPIIECRNMAKSLYVLRLLGKGW